MNEYIGAKYIGLDPIHMANGMLILNGEVTTLLSQEAAMNDNMFEPVYKKDIKEKVIKPTPKKTSSKKSKKDGDK